jgi:S-adenosylmethionine/arginine decarboxylase-like enzyme
MAMQHKHLIVRAEVLRPPSDETLASEQVRVLIERIGMQILMGPYAKYVTVEGNRGLTVATIIETSHVVMHTWDESDPAVVQLDVYTCGSLNTDTVFDWLEQYQPVRKQYKYLDRESDLVLEPVSDPQDRRQGRYSTQELVDATLAWIGD